MITVLSLILLLVVAIIVINNLQTRKPNWLPPVLRNWEFLPKALQSLEPYDRFMMNYILCCKKFKANDKVSPINEEFKMEVIIEKTEVVADSVV